MNEIHNQQPPHGWTVEQWQVLTEQLRLTTVPSNDPQHSVPVSQLLNEQGALHYIEQLRDLYESDDLPFITSMLAKRYSYMIVAPALYAMTVYGKGLHWAPEQCTLESHFKGDIWLPQVRLDKPEAIALHLEPEAQPALSEQQCECANHEAAQHQRQQYLTTIFAGHLQPVWHSLARAAGVSRAILWENAAVYVYYVYETLLADPIHDTYRARIEADFAYLTEQAPPSVFGEKWNPLARFNTPKRRSPGSDIPKRIRKTCCLYYLSGEDAGYCSVCPKREA
ncbi:IucA/IucC family C-terminal-domain containing protein [Paenibacillus wenxiniae]|uniref:IucA/IucC family C-terminal-domain containing protein n=1 Tax=Paenibacillus wenxiniae TaxID=1636843 RepID=A0ABW4RJH9_9BACL